ncbi:hypothetical protein [Desulfitibacter alkalitolerans]|nr:hypothetical protein [Desulfitibacter alkalitolerans]
MKTYQVEIKETLCRPKKWMFKAKIKRPRTGAMTSCSFFFGQ